MNIKNMKKIVTLISLSLLLMIELVTAQSHLWGTCGSGGAHGLPGTIFRTDINGNNLDTVYSLVNSLGSFPLGTMVMANNGKFYGVTYQGGAGNFGVCYSYDPISDIFTDIHDFSTSLSFGGIANSGMLLASNGKLYGLTEQFGMHGEGVIYCIDPNTNIYSDIYNFSLSTGAYPNGILMQLSNGKLYGMTTSGGAYNGGVIFSLNPADSVYSLLYSFDTLHGISPYYGGLLKATDGKLYGLTQQGGTNNNGVIFSFDTATNIYTVVYDFDSIHGSHPGGSLIQATNGLLYGMTGDGGTYVEGVIFSFDINSNSYIDLYDFNDSSQTTICRSLMQASNGLLFGTRFKSGLHQYGKKFSFDISTNIYNTKYYFDGGMYGGNPDCDIIEIPDSLTTGIKAFNKKEGLTLYPNPTSGIFTLSYNSQLSIHNSQLKIYDVLGQEVYTQAITNPNQTTIIISQLSNGVYFYQVINNKETVRGKFVKE